jgi:hypothetical protein
MFSKELIKDSALTMGVSPTAAGFLAGAGGGVCQVRHAWACAAVGLASSPPCLCQVSVMGPCTFLVTSVVTNKNVSLSSQIATTWRTKVCGAVAAGAGQETNPAQSDSR